jgi:hypothetical protein
MLAACGTDTPTSASPDAVLSADVAMIAGDAAAQEVEVMRGPGAGPFALGLLARAGFFDCIREARSRFAVDRTCTYKDAAGGVQTAYDPLTTATVVLHAEFSAEIERGPWSGSVEWERDLTVTGLAGAETEMTWNGSGSGSTTRVRVLDGGQERRYELSTTSSIDNVVIPVPRSATSWPRSGSIRSTTVVTRADGSTHERTVVVTFNGTNIVPVTVNGETFEYDLSQRGRARRR